MHDRPRPFRDRSECWSMRVIKFYEGSLGDIEAYFRCDMTQASSQLQQWDEEQEAWVDTQFQAAETRHTVSGMISCCDSLMAQALEIPSDEFTCEHAEVDTFGFTVADPNSSDDLEDFPSAVERIAEWFEDADQWATGDGDAEMHRAIRKAIDLVEQPQDGGIEELEAFAVQICDAVAKAMGGKDFHGHGNYSVSAADRIGIRLTVTEIDRPE